MQQLNNSEPAYSIEYLLEKNQKAKGDPQWNNAIMGYVVRLSQAASRILQPKANILQLADRLNIEKIKNESI